MEDGMLDSRALHEVDRRTPGAFDYRHFALFSCRLPRERAAMGAGGAWVAEVEVDVVENVQGASAGPDGQRVQPRGSQEAEIGSTLCGSQGAFGQYSEDGDPAMVSEVWLLSSKSSDTYGNSVLHDQRTEWRISCALCMHRMPFISVVKTTNLRSRCKLLK